MSAFEWLLVALGIGALFLAGWAFARSVLEEFPAARCDDFELREQLKQEGRGGDAGRML